ncbi:MAG: hypothetical protein H6712_08815 [Myxococcales bacterium]|nr:hypothetical protein [Myxococcales bacterium]MCB9713941.1 hypothetical protein [Myxococcales bacterium]
MIGSSIVSSQQDGLVKLARHARVVLVLIASLQAGAAALLYVAGGPAEEPLILPAIVGAVLYGVLAIWASSAPMPAVIVGLVLYLSSIGYSVAQGASPFDGLLLKGIILVLFVNGLGAARNYDDAKRRIAQQGSQD